LVSVVSFRTRNLSWAIRTNTKAGNFVCNIRWAIEAWVTQSCRVYGFLSTVLTSCTHNAIKDSTFPKTWVIRTNRTRDLNFSAYDPLKV
jgi:hypothetical protein